MDDDPRPLFARTLSRGQLIGLDVLVAVGYTFLSATLTVGATETALPVWARCLLVTGVGAPVAVRRLWPLPVFGVVFALSLLSVVLGVVTDPFLAAAYALYPVALGGVRRPGGSTVVIGVLSGFGALAVTLSGSRDSIATVPVPFLVGAVLIGGAWTIGRAVRERRGYAARSAEALAGRAVTEERLRIARELHDVVAHNLSLITVQAGVAAHVAERRPAEVRDALGVIETTSRDALAELRDMLGVLRSETDVTDTADTADTADRPAELSPAPGLDGLPGLVDRASLGGVRVDLDVRGVDGLAQGVALSVYRIVQEALTNVIKHAAPAHCRIVVDGHADGVWIEVTDDGPGTRVLPDGGGHGLIGMRERVLMHGGWFSAGPRAEGGFAVSARLPREASGSVS